MVNNAFKMAEDVDVILFLVDGTKNKIGKGDYIILEKLKQQHQNVILIINKIDLVNKESILKIIDMYSKEYEFKTIIPISAFEKKYIEKILNEIEKILPIGPRYYTEDEYTDQTERQLVEEIVREKVLQLIDEEIPHGVFVEVEKMQFSKTKKEENIYNIDICIYCIRKSHKGIIIGKEGKMLKKIGTLARKDLEKILQEKVNLSIWVKVKEDWQNQKNMLEKYV